MTAKPRKNSAKIPKGMRFEDALGELEGIVRKLESGEQSLEESIEQFERGVGLSRYCRDSLVEAEQKVRVLMADGNGEETLAEFEPTR